MSKTELASFRIKAFIIKFCFAAAALALVFIFVFSVRIKTVKIEGNTISSEEQITSSANLKSGAHMYSINKDNISAAILKANPYVNSVTIRRKLPSTLVITVTEDKPAFYTSSGSGFLILSKELRVLGTADSAYELSSSGIIPVVLPPIAKAETGKKLEFETSKGYAFNTELIRIFTESEMAEGITSIDLSSKFDVSAVYKSKYTIVFGTYTDLEKKLKFCKKTINYLEKTMPGVAGTVYATGTDEISFLVTGTAD